MYFMEWLWWQGATETAEEREETDKAAREAHLPDFDEYEDEIAKDREDARRCISATPRARGPVYVFNERILELRCGGQEDKRGLVTVLSVMLLAVFGYFMLGTALQIGFALITDTPLFASTQYQRSPNGGDIFLLVITTVMGGGGLWGYFKYGFRFSRLEMLTTRHLLIRFNRVTRQVHLHRPRNCGGLITLPWNGIRNNASTSKATEAHGIGECLTLMWQPEPGSGMPAEFVSVGRKANGLSELRDEWEFIRRFMEDGPDGLPRPSITSHFPWPWHAFAPQFEGLTRYLRNTDSGLVLLGLLMISPAFVVMGVGHWLSLLLCWKPRWPKVIREAGLPGKPVPHLTTLADYPPDIQQRLLANADKWALRPGSRPKRKPRVARRKKSTEPQSEVARAADANDD
ncbi:DUF6708 domain-containing protein [Lysobacter arvi]|uniref:DUF6708 domain-containing protein n=1 Tax=Lysobacter arvi TaxID=3038776 RepID=A0ABU1CE55_9GAMM|nr:DUF6708 domain-containing protein [Lysobacter arvi]MDR0183448.1 hypothetical protein [Lysobacter arvi]